MDIWAELEREHSIADRQTVQRDLYSVPLSPTHMYTGLP